MVVDRPGLSRFKHPMRNVACRGNGIPQARLGRMSRWSVRLDMPTRKRNAMADRRARSAGRESDRDAVDDLDVMSVTRNAMDQLSLLTNREVEGVSRLEHDDDGWIFQVELVELDRIPDSTSVVASYETHTDEEGNVVSYKRTRRFTRNQAGDL